jgi:hypothetical protein
MASPARKGTSGGRFGDRHQIRSASSSKCSKSIWKRIRLFHPNELGTDVVLRAAPAVDVGHSENGQWDRSPIASSLPTARLPSCRVLESSDALAETTLAADRTRQQFALPIADCMLSAAGRRMRAHSTSAIVAVIAAGRAQNQMRHLAA